MAIRRREFLAGVGGVGLGLGLGGVSHLLPLRPPEVGPDWSPGREESVASTCLLCPSHCGIRGRVVDGTLVRVDGNPLHPVSRGGLCPKGRAGIQLLYHPARLTGPVERTGPAGSGEFRPISWDDALNRVTATLADLRDRGDAASVVWLEGFVRGIMAELADRFTRVYGTPHRLRDDYDDGSAEVMRLCQGIASPPAFDLSESDLVVAFGAGLSEAWWGLPQAARARDPEGGRRPSWIQIDIRHSRTAARADRWIAVRPGTFGSLALGIGYILLKEGLYDADKVRSQVHGLEDRRGADGTTIPGFRSLVLRYGRTEEVSDRTGVRAEDLVRLAKTIGTARRAVAVWDQSVSWRSGGLSDALAIHTLNILIGALDRPGGVLVQPPLPVPSLAGSHGKTGERSGSLPPPGVHAHDWAGRIAAGQPPDVKALFLYYSNPAASAPNAEEVRRALERIPLVVSFSPFLDESARYAHLVLPDHTYLERWQDAPAPPSVPIPVWGIVQPMSPPLHDTRNTGDVLLDLATRLGGEMADRLPWSSVEQLVGERGRALAAARRGSVMDRQFRRQELRELEARGWWLPHRMSPDEFWESLRQTGGWFDPYYDYNDRSSMSHFADGKVRVFSGEARDRIALVSTGLVAGFLPWPEHPEEDHEDPEYPLRLAPYRVMTLSSGGTPLMPWLLENLGILTGDAWETWAEINPETGREHGLVPGKRVEIRSRHGRFRARLRFFAGAQPGVVNVPYGLHTRVEGWGSCEPENPLNAVGTGRDPATGLPDWHSTRVRVIPA